MQQNFSSKNFFSFLIGAALFVFASLCVNSRSQAQVKDFVVPELTGPVIDQAGLLDRSAIQEITQALYSYNNSGKAQIQVLTVPDLQGWPIEQASIKIVEKWKLGQAKQDNGVLVLVSSKDHRLRIEVGQGLEGALPDAIASRIVHDVMIPNFKANRPGEGILAGVYEIIRYVDKEYADKNLPEPEPQTGKSSGRALLELAMLALFVIFIIAKGGGGRGYGGGYRSGGFGGGGFGGGSSSGGGSWGGGGGGFSGGGSSGSW